MTMPASSALGYVEATGDGTADSPWVPRTAGDPCEYAAAVTPNDGADLANPGYLYVGGAGNIAVVTTGGSAVTITGAAAGTVIPLKIARVKSTGTTATSILVLYNG